MTTYDFTKDLAANIVYAEVKHFAAEESVYGRSEDEVQTLTRRLSYLVDRDLHWTDVDELIDQVRALGYILDGSSGLVSVNATQTVDNRDVVFERTLAYVGSNIASMLGTVKTRFEVAA